MPDNRLNNALSGLYSGGRMTVRKWEKVGDPKRVFTGLYGKNIIRQQFRNPKTDKIEDFDQFTPPDWATCLAITKDGQVIVQSEYMQGRDTIEDGLMAETFNPNESPVDAVARGIKEETGFAAMQIISLGTAWLHSRSSPTRGHLFLALDCVKVGDQNLDDVEEIETRLMPLNEWLTMVMHGMINEWSAVVTTVRALPHLGVDTAMLNIALGSFAKHQ